MSRDILLATTYHINLRHEFITDPAAVIADATNPMGWPTGTNKEGVELALAEDETEMGGYWVEFKFPFTALNTDAPSVDKLIGVEWQQNDNDSRNREHISKWWLQTGDDSWLYNELFGTGVLSQETVSKVLEIKKVPASETAPVIDAQMDAIYEFGTVASQNHYRNVGASGPSPRDFHDCFTRSYLLWDDANFYAYFSVNDDTLDDDHANAWERDAVEVYFETENVKGHSYVATTYHINLRHEFITDPAAAIADATNPMGWPTGTNLEGVEMALEDTDLGYTVEIKFPWTALNTEASVGKVMGFEIQTNDNDGRNREHITKWWLETGDDSWLYNELFGTIVLGADAVVGIQPEPGLVANRFDLAQNYPNPFNPSTTISYTLTKNDHARLVVYDLVGREVAVLVNGTQAAGSYNVSFNASNLSSGVYFYQLQTGGNVFTKKMMLMK